MAPTDLFSSLAGGLGDEAYYQSQDPFFQGARSVAGWQYQPTNSSEAVWMPAVQGLLTGLLGGYGKQQAQEAAYQDYSSNPLLKALAGQTMGPLSEADALHDYTRPEMPEGWNTRIGKQDLQAAILGRTLAYEEVKRKRQLRDEMQKLLMGKGAIMTDAGEIAPLPGLAQVEASAKAQEAAAKIKSELKAQSDMLGYNPKAADETDKLRKEFSALPEVKNFSNVEKSAKIILQAIADPNAVSDQELTRYSILLIEPGMAVREGEQAAVANSASIPDAWKGEISKAIAGGAQLGPNVREGLKRLAMRSYEGNKQQYDRTLSFYKNQAIERGLDPSAISYLGDAQDTQKLFGIPPGAVPTGKTSKGKPVYSVNGKLWVPD